MHFDAIVFLFFTIKCCKAFGALTWILHIVLHFRISERKTVMAFYDNHYSNFFRIIIFIKGLSKNYVAKNVGMKSTRFSALAQTLFSSESSRTLKFNQTTAELSFGWVFGVQLGLRQLQALISTNHQTMSSSNGW